MLKTAVTLVCSVIVLTAAVDPSAAQIPDEFTNLEVLPKDIGKREMVRIMRAFSGAIGVRCVHCHVGEDPQDLATFDFASDDKEPKLVAREMMKMTNEINTAFLPASGRDDLTRVTCKTCHRGVEIPEDLKDILLAAADKDGAEAAEQKYRQLREEYYGKGAYDFGAGTLSGAAEELATKQGDIEGAIRLARLNVEFHPDLPFAHLLLGQLLMQTGDEKAAIASVERSLELDPENQWAKRMLQQLRASEHMEGHDH